MKQRKAAGDVGTDEKPDVKHAEPGVSKGYGPVMRSKLDDLSVWKSVWRYRRVGCVSMLAAFSASLDGYRELYPPSSRYGENLNTC